jgi:hypothetical protein
MSTWLARLKNQNTPGAGATKPTKPTQDTHAGGFVGFVAHPQGHIQKFDGAVANPETPAANAPTTDPDRWAWPHSSAMNGQEIDTLMARQALFCQRGAAPQDAERLADSLVNRDRDERRPAAVPGVPTPARCWPLPLRQCAGGWLACRPGPRPGADIAALPRV